MIELSVFYGTKRTATIYKVQNYTAYMVSCEEENENFIRKTFFTDQQKAEDFAEDWINE